MIKRVGLSIKSVAGREDDDLYPYWTLLEGKRLVPINRTELRRLFEAPGRFDKDIFYLLIEALDVTTIDALWVAVGYDN